jgi:hypothetical protein
MAQNQSPSGTLPVDSFSGAASADVPVLRIPRSVAFVWGGEVNPSPSLPYGRWKPGARAA